MDAAPTHPHGTIWHGATVLVVDDEPVLTDISMPVIDGRQVSETLARYRPGVALLRATDLAAVAEAEIVRAHAGLSKLALALEASRTMRVQTLDLVVAARELRRAAGGLG
jgi:hypothetical protein